MRGGVSPSLNMTVLKIVCIPPCLLFIAQWRSEQSVVGIKGYVLTLLHSKQVASQVGAMDIGYRAGFSAENCRNLKLLYLLGAVSSILRQLAC